MINNELMPRKPKGEKALSSAERTSLSRHARQQEGKRIDVMLSQDATKALELLRQEEDLGNSTKSIIEALLLKEAKRRGKGKEI